MPFRKAPAQAVQLHQIVYCSSEQDLLGGDGVGPVASSIGESELRRWDSILRIRVNQADDGRSSLCYLLPGDGQAALLYRTGDPRLQRRTAFGHALIGPIDAMGIDSALGAWRWKWDGALTPDRPDLKRQLETVDAGRFTESVRDECTRVFAEGRKVPELDWLIIDILRASCDSAGRAGDRKFAIITNGTDGLPCHLLAGLASRLEMNFIHGGFSTNEAKYADGEQTLPRFVFATEPPRVSFSQTSRDTVDIRTVASRPDRDVQEAAKFLVNAYHEGESHSPGGGLVSVARLANGQLVRGVTAEHAQFASSFLARRYGRIPPPEPVTITGPRPDPQAPAPAIAGVELSNLSDQELAERIATVTPEDAVAVTAELHRRADEQSAGPDRAEARQHLIWARFHADYLKSALPGPELDALFDGIAHFAFAGNDIARVISANDIVLLAEVSRHLSLIQLIAARIWPTGEVPYACAADVGRSLLSRLGVETDAPPPAPGPSWNGTPRHTEGDRPHQLSPGVLGSLAIAIFVLAVLALLVRFGLS